MTVYNISRAAAQAYDGPLDNIVWISIQEPENSHIKSKLNAVPHLKLKFHDVTKTTSYVNFLTGKEEFVRNPPTPEHAKRIIEFLLEYKGKDVISNCALGWSRSSAISKFCVDYLGYEWDEESRERADPNKLLYQYLVEEFEKIEQK